MLEGQTYVISGYLATLAALLILAGRPRRPLRQASGLFIGLVGFAATSALCGLAPSSSGWWSSRLAQGAAGALLVPGSLALITHAFDDGSRGRAFGIWAASTLGLTVLGAGPRWAARRHRSAGASAFLINVPLLAVALFATVRHVAESRDTSASSDFDWLGAARRGPRRRWPRVRVDPRPVSTPGQDPAAWIAIADRDRSPSSLFPIAHGRRRDPLVPLALFRSRDFAVDQPRHVLHLRRAVRHA